MTQLQVLVDPEMAIIFETSPLGLGHLRVTDALYHGLPKTASPILFGAQAPASSAMYRFASVHKSTRTVLEMLQLPPLDQPVAAIGRTILRHQTKDLYSQLKRILNERFTVPKSVLLVATHAIHAHPLGAVKEKLSRELGIKAFLVVQVTDDSPQAIWYVTDADMIFVPSEYTKEKLQAYAKKARLPEVPIVVTAYPVSPLLTEEMSEHMVSQRKEQLREGSESTTHVSVPVPGAAVGTDFMATFVQTLHQKSQRYHFHIVAREAPFTQKFVQTMTELPYVTLSVSSHERATIDNYEKVFKEHNIALELTKPSEQAFKVLAQPKDQGGSLLLFSHPVGGQEYDNVRFLHTHGFVPTDHESQALWDKSQTGEHVPEEILRKVISWRGLLLPEDPEASAVFTDWCLREGIFTKMMEYKLDQKRPEVQSNGVEQFWNHVADLVEKQSK